MDVYDKPIPLGGPATCLVFTTVDCPIANSYQPELGRIEKDFRRRKVTFIQVHVDPSVTVAQVKAHAHDYKIKWRLASDPLHLVVARYGASVTPEAVVLGPDGAVRYQGRIDDLYADLGKRRAQATTHELRDALSAVVSGHAPAVTRAAVVGCTIPPIESLLVWPTIALLYGILPARGVG